jgi:hypothetical protein
VEFSRLRLRMLSAQVFTQRRVLISDRARTPVPFEHAGTQVPWGLQFPLTEAPASPLHCPFGRTAALQKFFFYLDIWAA